MNDLSGKVALVTGASRGAGRGIALALGAQGATVYVTGRSTPGSGSAEGLSGTVEETASAVTARGGTGRSVVCDHTDDAQVEALFDRIREEAEGLDVLVNNVWGGYEHYDFEGFSARFWRQPRSRWDDMFVAGVRAHLVASQLAAPLMLPRGGGLIVNTTYWDADKYLGNLYYDVAKAAVNRMVYGLAAELRPYHIAALALSPGFMRTERVMATHAAEPFDLARTETVAYVGRAVAALASDDRVIEKTGRVVQVGDLAREYGFADVDGAQAAPFEIPVYEYEKEER
jgi:NAD(P)-dependent dehydrogenase (short-subunit alcohol dehydrogenase family)